MPPTLDQKLVRFLQKYNQPTLAEPPVAVFDCDDTLIKGDIGESMFYFQLEHFLLRVSPASLWPDHPKHEELGNLYEGLCKLPPDKAVHDRRFISFAEMMLDWYFDQLAEGKTAKACSDIVRLFTGFTPTEVRQIAQATVRKELGAQQEEWKMGRHTLPRGIRFIQESLEMLRALKSRGFDIWVISGSNRWSVQAVCELVGIPPDHVLGIGLTDENGEFASAIEQPVPVLEGKVEALKQRVMFPPTVVVSDSTYDIPLFRYSTDLKVLIKPSNGKDFFEVGNIMRDDSWIVIETPTLIEKPED
jgi:phosphoserine phosphatase